MTVSGGMPEASLTYIFRIELIVWVLSLIFQFWVG